MADPLVQHRARQKRLLWDPSISHNPSKILSSVDKPLFDLSLAFSDALFLVDLFLLVFVGKETRLGTIDRYDNISDLQPCNMGINFAAANMNIIEKTRCSKWRSTTLFSHYTLGL